MHAKQIIILTNALLHSRDISFTTKTLSCLPWLTRDAKGLTLDDSWLFTLFTLLLTLFTSWLCPVNFKFTHTRKYQIRTANLFNTFGGSVVNNVRFSWIFWFLGTALSSQQNVNTFLVWRYLPKNFTYLLLALGRNLVGKLSSYRLTVFF